ncbi:C39 family peptidase [Kitasatospora sp. NBC_01287]|uniref:papain-like cysteine protease family protein n=1 Tax=Kitasatospora sp. NBC_01287 TaxID=2903573 RepID=UPI0022531CFA|nr:papain-like cysteine protease family protein [Kitasatospora sp. NBC_01287]MCX4747038.1 C39 family peptidase [Kitasatospora sp. NBC_01287]
MSAPRPPARAASRLRRALAVAALAALAPALTVAAGSPATAAAGSPANAAAGSAAPLAQARPAFAAGTETAAGGTARTLNISMQQQQNSNWCWAASGDTIASWFGYDYSQNQFCDAAFGRSTSSTCPNSEAALNNVQTALDWIGIDPGDYVTGYLYYSTVQNEINNNRPVETRIQWSSGGGHMEVLYGYDLSDNWVYWGDPWPSDNRYNWASYSYYVSNSSFSWTHSLYQIGA